MYTQVPHVDHGQGAEKRRGLELQVAKVAKRGEVEDDPEAHEKCPPAAWIIHLRPSLSLFVVDIDLRVIGLLNPRGRGIFMSKN